MIEDPGLTVLCNINYWCFNVGDLRISMASPANVILGFGGENSGVFFTLNSQWGENQIDFHL